MPIKSKLQAVIFAVLAGGAVIAWLWVYWPQNNRAEVYLLPDIHFPTLNGKENPQASIAGGLVEAQLLLPHTLHLGETTAVTLTVRPVENGAQSNLPESALLMAEARLDLPLIPVDPAGGVQQPFDPDTPVHFKWMIQPNQVGDFEGQFWLYLVAVNETGQTDRQAVLSVPVHIKTSSLLGFSEKQLTWFGLILAFSAAISILFKTRSG